MDYKKIVDAFIKGVLDCLEDCFSSFTIASGKNTLYVFLVCVCLMVYSILTKLFSLYSFVNWQETVPAVLVMGTLTLLNHSNDKAIGKIKNLLHRKE